MDGEHEPRTDIDRALDAEHQASGFLDAVPDIHLMHEQRRGSRSRGA